LDTVGRETPAVSATVASVARFLPGIGILLSKTFELIFPL
jgi:hypothetical protein